MRKKLRDKINKFRAGYLTTTCMSLDEKCAIYRKLFTQKNDRNTPT